MAEVVVIGAGLSGTLMAYELLPQLGRIRKMLSPQDARGESEPFYERFMPDKLNIAKIREVRTGT
ncbi:putative NAD(P)/FAD-binding protein YdhS [Bradyrhizobium japonicum]|jgi:uncharacterized NAD(P)/FAD-binding protein YdhS|uniref:NAD(P)/FAD-binding protein YdhS n=2 Tax=Bradyrhizobium elkanii TaxID=29448 RepID=A0A1E3EI59_BRAEL|nr:MULTISPECIES: hypothetical protein [Bradyrhizobium]MBP1290699.1 putative NAD(P)/FAD-binding protein YdhS [Bradyrhizobium elkanii]MBP2429245.1 putative NAD(P)/FAD-binding protein YdhS [Bradyrhizobium elkanii]MCP1737284.1 putative NAD(P)/FAD-binding protein YdhS [Bradyrhizobium elkanii]MCP1755330.1 putative NAD(P)/FAD-binding protein YdhS [Bradyrhizobium elkanii]MCP1928985.1 putative NAD(P)/FAD-binding protein YdhS [Bradyrhizobium elkanii]